jgi:signal peptide peptidase SppA
VKDGILQIPVKGVLLHDFPYAFGDYATGYPYIWRAYQRGMDDGQVKGIALVVDSPGGEVAGNFDLVDKMFARRDEKEVRAYAAESMYSAAYSIGSVASKIIVSRTGGVGSIGVVTGHVDMSGALEQRGFKVTFIYFGKHKVDGNPYEPLPKAVQARIQKRIDELGEVFVSTVARNRGMDAQAIRDTEALTYTATDGVAIGLADEVGSLDDSLVAFATDMSEDEEDETMAVITQADVDSARAAGVTEGKAAAAAEIATAHAVAITAARAEGAKTEKDRINGILASDAAKTKPSAALAAAMDTDLSVEQASKFPGQAARGEAPGCNAAGCYRCRQGQAFAFCQAHGR